MNNKTQDSRPETQYLRIIDQDSRRMIYHLVRLVSCILCLMYFWGWIAVSEAKIIERIITIVNDDIITQTELDERLEKEKEVLRLLYQFDESRLARELEKLNPAEVLDMMVNEALFLQEAVNKGIKVSDAEIEQFINSLIKQYGSVEAFQEALKGDGYTEYTFKKERKRAVLRQRLIEREFESELEVTDDDVRKFYRENRDMFPGRSDVVKLKHIFIEFQTTEADREAAFKRANDILKRIKDGADFAEIAKNFSDHQPTKASGGDMGYFIPGLSQNDPKLEEAAAKLAVGEMSELIETPGGYDIIKVIDIKDNAIRARRIYVAIWPNQESEKQAEEKANFILGELEAGADFLDLVTKYSNDPLAIEKNGDWKEIPIDMMTPELQKGFDSFNEGEISRPVKTPVGVHIFRVETRQDLAKDEIEELRRSLSNRRFNEKIKEYSEKLKEKAYITQVGLPAKYQANQGSIDSIRE